MVVTSVLSTDAEMIAMAGSDVDTTGFSDDNKTAWGIQAEAFLCMATNYDLVTNVADLKAKFKAILSEYVARYVAMSGLGFNPLGKSGSKTRIQFEDETQVHVFRMNKIEKQLAVEESLTSLGVT